MRPTVILFLFLAGTGKLFSQTIPISGPSPVTAATQQTYVADLSGVTQTPGSIVTWSVDGGEIVSAITDPTAASVYCVVKWNYWSGTYSVSASVNSPAQSGTKQIVLSCYQSSAGNDITICPGDSTMLGAANMPGFSYMWGPRATLDNGFIAQPIAFPTQTTTYRLWMMPTPPNLVQNGDFENGYTGFGTDYPAYSSTIDAHGTQAITTDPHSVYSGWCFVDAVLGTHMLAVGGPATTDPANYRIWYTTIAVLPNTNYSFSFGATSLVSGKDCQLNAMFTGNNTGITTVSFSDVTRSCSASWGVLMNWYSGTNTEVTLDLRFRDFPASSQYVNEVAIDNISFKQNTNCLIKWDTVIVSVGARPIVSPSGPIEYYYLEENVTPQIGITLSSETLAGYQWYKDGVAISGATSQTYKTKSTGAYTVQGSGCPSEDVLFYDHAKGPDDRSSIGEPLDFPAGVHSPTYYCFNSTNYIKTFDLGSSANYYWETYTPGGAADQVTINTSTYNIHSPQADVSIGGSPANATTILGYAELDGYVKAMEFSHFYYSSQSTPLTGTENICAGSSFNVTNYNSFTSSQINPGASRFNWETYDVGSSGEILSPDPTLYPDPSDPTNTKKIRVAGKNGYTGGITVRFNSLPGRIKKYFYTNDGDCYQDSKRYEADLGCRMSQAVNDGVSLYPNPARTTVTVTAADDILQAEILDINYSTVLQVIRKKPGSKTIYLDVSRYKQGVYNCRITTATGVVNKKLVITP